MPGDANAVPARHELCDVSGGERIKRDVRLVLLLLLLGTGSAGSFSQPPRILARGQLRLPAARAFGEPGFHQVLVAAGRVPTGALLPARSRLVLSLRDAGRPRQRCTSDHPLSGCATVDWADFPGRPKVPAGGVFENSITVHLVSGARTFFLGPSGTLAERPIRYEPG